MALVLGMAEGGKGRKVVPCSMRAGTGGEGGWLSALAGLEQGAGWVEQPIESSRFQRRESGRGGEA